MTQTVSLNTEAILLLLDWRKACTPSSFTKVVKFEIWDTAGQDRPGAMVWRPHSRAAFQQQERYKSLVPMCKPKSPRVSESQVQSEISLGPGLIF